MFNWKEDNGRCAARRSAPSRDATRAFEVYGLDLHGPRRERLQPWLIEVNPGFKDLYLYPPRMLPLAAAAISLLPRYRLALAMSYRYR